MSQQATIEIKKNPAGGVVAVINSDESTAQYFSSRKDAIVRFEKLAAARYMHISWKIDVYGDQDAAIGTRY
ncbi:MAG: hypothetical protein WBY44_30205 [Bryobacteraceae bacterium]